MSDQEEIVIDLTPLREIAGDDDMFVAALLGKMVKQLPISFADMERTSREEDWPGLKAAAHKAKSTFAYLGLEDMRGKLKDIEHNAMDGVDLDKLPEMVESALELGNRILVKLKEELMKLM